MPESRPQPRGSLSLVGILGVVLALELWLNRIGARLLHLDPVRRLQPEWRRLDVIAFFVFELASVLGAFLLLGALGRIVASRAHRGPLRLSIALVGGVSTILILGGTFARLPPRFQAHLYMSAIFLLVVLSLRALATASPLRNRVGVLLLSLPLGLMLAANLVQRLSAPGVLDPRASVLAEAAGGALVAVGFLAPWLFAPEGAAGALALAAGALTCGGGMMLGKLDWDLAVRLAGVGLGVAIPVGTWPMPVYVLGAAGLVYTTFALLGRAGPERLRGVGLFLVGAIALQLELPYQIAGSLLGLLCLVESLTLPVEGAITREAFDARLRHLAQVLGAGQVTVVGPDGRDRARLGFTVTGGIGAQLCIDRRGGAIASYELSIGDPPARTPPFTLSTRGARRLGPQAPGPVVSTDDAAFDTRFVVRDHRGVGTSILDAETRTRLAQLVEGWLGVWPQRATRFVGTGLPRGPLGAAGPDDGDEGLRALVQLLTDLRARAGA